MIKWAPQHRSTLQHPGTAHSTEIVAVVAEGYMMLAVYPLGGTGSPELAPLCPKNPVPKA